MHRNQPKCPGLRLEANGRKTQTENCINPIFHGPGGLYSLNRFRFKGDPK